jgi:HAD superfamily hydrolase (TIGR01450 family)
VTTPAGNIVCDLDGVVYVGATSIPGAGEALGALEARGYRLIFATNAPIRTAAEVARHIAVVSGYPAREDQVITSGMAAAALLGSEGGPVLVIGESGLGATLAGAGLALTADPDAARAVVVGLDRELTFDHLAAATRAVLRGARLVACNRDATYPTESGLLPGGGAIAAAIEVAGGREAEVAGKPFAPMTAAIRRALGSGPTWVVGDRPETDLALGRDQGWTTVLVLSGVISDPAAVAEGLRPDLVLRSLADLPALLP